MEKYIYSSAAGILVLDEKFSVVDKESITHPEFEQLDRNEWLDTELQLAKKHAKDKVFFIGFKREKKEGIILSQDPRKLSAILNLLREKEFLHTFYLVNLKATKLKIKNSAQADLLIIQASSNIDELHKTSSLLARRLREWYELYNPEFSKSIADHERFINLILTKSKKELLEEMHLPEIDSMGAELPETDVAAILALAGRIQSLYALIKEQELYLDGLMQKTCRNMGAVAGSLIGAKLVALAGSLKNLAEMPASTIQVLGAERALFRHLKNRNAKPPKYGVIMQHPLISNAKRSIHGKVSRSLAGKISIAVKMDYYGNEFIGDKLRAGLEAKFHG